MNAVALAAAAFTLRGSMEIYCGLYADIAANLAQAGEAPVVREAPVDDEASTAELWVGGDGATWTWVRKFKGGTACILLTGREWRPGEGI